MRLGWSDETEAEIGEPALWGAPETSSAPEGDRIVVEPRTASDALFVSSTNGILRDTHVSKPIKGLSIWLVPIQAPFPDVAAHLNDTKLINENIVRPAYIGSTRPNYPIATPNDSPVSSLAIVGP